jgi:death-on-curing protein
MAAAYAFHIVSNHPFVDGNKRAGAVAARVFLLLNDANFDPTEEAYGDLILAIASGQATKDDAIAFFRQHTTLPPKPDESR